MFTPGSEPILTVAVLGDQGAPVYSVGRALAERGKAQYGDEAALHINPFLLTPPDWPLSFPTWALLRLPSRLLALAVMQSDAANLTDIAWHLNQADAVLLVARASGELTPALRDLLLLAAHRGLDKVVVFLDTFRLSADDVDEAERQLRLALLMAGLPGDDLPVVRGTGRAGEGADEALAAVEAHFRTPTWDAEGPFRMIVRSGGRSPDLQHRDARGRISSGRVARGDSLEAFSARGVMSVVAREIIRFGARLNEASAGQNVSVVFTDPKRELNPDQRDLVLAFPGSMKLRSSFRARLTFFRTDEGGRHRYVMNGFTPSFWMPAAQRRARIELLDRPRANPGETFPIRATFPDGKFMPVSPGDAFIVRHSSKIIGHGVVEAG
jgi:translation elongation factor EF-Tu-like GTPase